MYRPCLHCEGKKYDEDYCPEICTYGEDRKRLKELEQIETGVVAPVVHGRWLRDGDFLICLNCESEINVKNSLGVENKKNFCPGCGAKMDQE